MLKVNEYFKDVLNTYSMYDTASVNTLAVFPLSAASVGGIVFSGIPPAFGPSLLILKRDRRGNVGVQYILDRRIKKDEG